MPNCLLNKSVNNYYSSNHSEYADYHEAEDYDEDEKEKENTSDDG